VVPENKSHPTRFQPGQSGNPAGRPQGARNKASAIAEAFMAGALEEVLQATVERAKKGSDAAQRLVVTRLVPAARRRSVTLELPATLTPADVARALSETLQALARGEVTPDEASSIASVLDAQRRAIESAELADRLHKVEEALGLAPPAPVPLA
jgi:hypothetical protein